MLGGIGSATILYCKRTVQVKSGELRLKVFTVLVSMRLFYFLHNFHSVDMQESGIWEAIVMYLLLSGYARLKELACTSNLVS